MAKRLITVLFAAQLFITTALCANACCGSDSNGRVSEPVSQKGEEEAAAPAGHCHSKPPSQKKSSKPAAKITTSSHDCHIARSSEANPHDLCACNLEREEQETSVTILAASSGNRDLPGIEAMIDSPPHWPEDASPPNDIASQNLRVHSPPHPGFQLSLRI